MGRAILVMERLTGVTPTSRGALSQGGHHLIWLRRVINALVCSCECHVLVQVGHMHGHD